MSAERVELLFDLPVDRTFTYAVPESLAGRLSPGHRVWAPFRGRPRLGVVARTSTADPGVAVSTIERMAEPESLSTPELLELARWASGQWLASWGEVIVRALPRPPSPRSRSGEGIDSFLQAAPASGPSPLPEPLAKSLGTPGRPTLLVGRFSADLVIAAGRELLAEGRGLLVVAPELEAVDRLEEALAAGGLAPARLDSGQPDRIRWQGWRAVAMGQAQIVVGSRSALWAPVTRLGLILVMEEEHPAHKSPERPRLHARDLAVERAVREGAACWLASRAPSVETYARVRDGLYRLYHLPEPSPWPPIQLVDLKGAISPLTPELLAGVRQAVADQASVLLLLNRRGSGTLLCRECGHLVRCLECGLVLVFSPALARLICRLCGRRAPVPDECPRCRGTRLSQFGWGIERVEREMRQRFPRVGIARFEEATTRGSQGSRLVEAFRVGKIRILVGTFHLAKALEVARHPFLTLISADGLLTVPDFRAGERTFQRLWGLAEEVGARGGRLLLQSHYPEHPAFRAIVSRDRSLFYREELPLRRELGYPPEGRLARLLVRDRSRGSAPDFARELVARLRARSYYRGVYGPVPLRGGVQLLVKGDEDLPGVLADDLAGLLGGRARVEVDVDPLEFS